MVRSQAALISVRSLNAAWNAFTILVSAAVCTLLASEFGNKARNDTQKSWSRALTKTRQNEGQAQQAMQETFGTGLDNCWGTASNNIKGNVNQLLKTVTEEALTRMRTVLERPQNVLKAFIYRMRAVYPMDIYDFAKLKTIRFELSSLQEEYGGTITKLGVAASTGEFIIMIEDDKTVADAAKYSGFHHHTVLTNDGQLYAGGSRDRPSLCTTGQSCAWLSDSVPEQYDPGMFSEVNGGRWMGPGDGQCPLGNCPNSSGIYGFGGDCYCNSVVNGQRAWNGAGMAYGVNDAGLPQTDCASLEHPLLRDPSHDKRKWSSGPCSTSYKLNEERWFLLAQVLTDKHTMRWLPVEKSGQYMGMTLVGSFGHPAMESAAFSAYAVQPKALSCNPPVCSSSTVLGQAGKAGSAMVTINAADITAYLQSLRISGVGIRVAVVTAADSYREADPGCIHQATCTEDTTGDSISVSHGQVYSSSPAGPQSRKAADAQDPVIRSTVLWINTEKRMASSGEWKLKHKIPDPVSGAGFGSTFDTDSEWDARANEASPAGYPAILAMQGSASPARVATNSPFYRAAGAPVSYTALVDCSETDKDGKALFARSHPNCAAGGELVEQKHWVFITRYTTMYGIDWWVLAAVDDESMLGNVNRNVTVTQDSLQAKSEHVQTTVTASRASIDTDIADEESTTDSDLDNNTNVLIGVVVGLAVVLVVASIVFISAVTQPILQLSAQMKEVATMNLDDVEMGAFSSLAEVKRMQRSFFRMVQNMRELRNFLPQSVTMADDDDDDGDIDDGGSKVTMTAVSKSAVSSKKHRGASKHATTKHGGASHHSQGGVASTAASSKSAAMRAYIRKVAGDGLKKKKATLLVVNLKNFHARLEEESSTDVVHAHEVCVDVVLKSTHSSRGVIEGFNGDRITSTFNAVKPLGTHRGSACACADSVRQGIAEGQAAHREATEPNMDQLEISAAACTGGAQAGNMGADRMRKFTIFAPFVTFCYALERVARSMDAEGTLIDAGVREDATNLFELAMLGDVVFPKRHKKPMPIWEVRQKKAASDEEWMYQLEEGEKGTGEINKWNKLVMAAKDACSPTMQQLRLDPELQGLLQKGTGIWLRNAVDGKLSMTTHIEFH